MSEIPDPAGEANAAYYSAAGRFIAIMSGLDYMLTLNLLCMVSPGDNALSGAVPLVAGTDFRIKLGMVRRLAVLHQASHAKSISKACDRLQAAYERRNTIAHCMTVTGRKPGEVMLWSLRLDADAKLPPLKFLRAENVKHWQDNAIKAQNALQKALQASGYPWMKHELEPELMPLPARKAREARQAQSRSAPPKHRKSAPRPAPGRG